MFQSLWYLVSSMAAMRLTVCEILCVCQCENSNCRWPGAKQVIGNQRAISIMTTLILSQCTLAGRVYTGMPLECHWLTPVTLGYHWATKRIFAWYTGTPMEKLSWNCTTLECQGETLTIFAYTGTPLEKLSRNCPALGCQWRNCNFCSLHWNTNGGDCNTQAHIVKQSSIHASLKRQDGGTPISKWKVSVNSAFTWSLLLCNEYQLCS